MNEGFFIIYNRCFLLFVIIYVFFVLRAVSVVSSTG